MKRCMALLGCIIMLQNLYSQNNDLFANNHTIQSILRRFNAKYKQNLSGYLNEYLGVKIETKGSLYSISNKKAYSFVREFLKANLPFYAYKVEENFGYDNKDDIVAIVEETDQIKLLKLMGIQGNDFEISNENVVKWFVTWNNEFKYRIVGVGIDFIQADILTEPKDYLELAKEVYSMCPDVVDQGTTTVEELAKEMRKEKTMYFWWD